MEQQRVSEPIHIGKIITIGSSTPQPQKPVIESRRSITATKLRPIVRTFKKPFEIVDEFLDCSDKSSMIKFISEYQKTGVEWDVFRKKIPDELLEKWAKVMWKCQENGFIAPRVENNVLHWRVIMTHHTDTCDKCTMCPTSWRAGDCKGKLKFKPNGERNWTPCWKLESAIRKN